MSLSKDDHMRAIREYLDTIEDPLAAEVLHTLVEIAAREDRAVTIEEALQKVVEARLRVMLADGRLVGSIEEGMRLPEGE